MYRPQAPDIFIPYMKFHACVMRSYLHVCLDCERRLNYSPVMWHATSSFCGQNTKQLIMKLFTMKQIHPLSIYISMRGTTAGIWIIYVSQPAHAGTVTVMYSPQAANAFSMSRYCRNGDASAIGCGLVPTTFFILGACTLARRFVVSVDACAVHNLFAIRNCCTESSIHIHIQLPWSQVYPKISTPSPPFTLTLSSHP